MSNIPTNTVTQLQQIDAWLMRNFPDVRIGNFEAGEITIGTHYRCGCGTATMQSCVEQFSELLRMALSGQVDVLIGVGDTWGWMRHWASDYYLLPSLSEIISDPNVETRHYKQG